MPLAGQVPDQGPRSQVAGRIIDDNRLGDIGIELFTIAPSERGLTYSVAPPSPGSGECGAQVFTSRFGSSVSVLPS